MFLDGDARPLAIPSFAPDPVSDPGAETALWATLRTGLPSLTHVPGRHLTMISVLLQVATAIRALCRRAAAAAR